VEIKSSQTISGDSFSSMKKTGALLGERVREKFLVYGGMEQQQRSDAEAMSYLRAGTIVTRLKEPF